MVKRLIPVIALVALAWAAGARADAYKCRAADGGVLVSATPCREGSKTLSVQPGEIVAPEARQRAEQEAERQRRSLAEREAVRRAETDREQENQRRLAAEESSRRTLCLQNAQQEPDPVYRADLIAACNGVAPQRPAVIQQPLYLPAVLPRRKPHRGWDCVSADCKTPQPHVQPPRTPPDQFKANCRRVDNVLRCD